MNWRLPPNSLLGSPPPATPVDLSGLRARLQEVLDLLQVPSKIVRVYAGPSTVSFELEPGADVTMRDYTKMGRADDIAFALEAEQVRIQAPIPGKRLVGIEIPSPVRRVVSLAELIDRVAPPLTVGLGVTPDGEPVALDVAALPHLLVAGASGSGKSSLLHSILTSLLMRVTPDELRLVLIDLKRTELGRYAGIPHLSGSPIDDADGALQALEGLVAEIGRREQMLSGAGVQNVEDFNHRGGKIPRILCVVDEFAELMLQSSKRMEVAVVRIGQLGRACGVHLVLATQSPHRQVFSGLIKANVPARIALRVVTGTHSRVALDQTGAEELLGHGDALLQDGTGVNLRRFQSAFVPADVIGRVVDYWVPQTPRVMPGPDLEPVYAPAPRPLTPGRGRALEPRRRAPRAPRGRSRRGSRRLILLAGLAAAIVLAVRAAPGAIACPSGSTYSPTGMGEVCQRPDGSVTCVYAEFGFTPHPEEKNGLQYVTKAPDGPWCRGAHDPDF